MRQLLPFVVIGLTTGSVYGLCAAGLVLTYRTSGVFNFAHGSMASAAVYVFYVLFDRLKLPWQPAALIAICVLGPVVGIGFERLAQRLTPLPVVDKVLATLGILLFVNGATALWGRYAFGPLGSLRHASFPSRLVRIGGVNVGVDQLIVMGVGLGSALGLYVVLQFTRAGLGMRAVVDNAELLGITGTNPSVYRRLAWSLGIGFVALSGILLVLSPSYSNGSSFLALLVLQAVGAAAIGRFSNLPLTYVGGLVVGLAAAIATKYVTTTTWLQGLPPSIPFLVLFVVTVLTPKSRVPRETGRSISRWPLLRTSRPSLWYSATGLTVILLFLVPVLGDVHLLYTADEALPYAILFLSLTLVIKMSGQLSFCHLGLAAVGASAFARIFQATGLPWPACLVLAGLTAVPVGAVVAIPAIRVSGVYVAIATFGLAVLLEQLFYGTSLMFLTPNDGAIPVPRPRLSFLDGSSDKTFYVELLVCFLITLAVVTAIGRTRLGRILRALADSPLALETQGTTVNVTRVTIFCISAFFAGVAGALLVSQGGFLISEPFGSNAALTLVTVVLTLRIPEPWSALGAAVVVVVLPSFLNGSTLSWIDVVFGIGALFAVLGPISSLLSSMSGHLRRMLPARIPRKAQSAQPAFSVSSRSGPARFAPHGSPGLPPRARGEGLCVNDLTVTFGGLVAVENFSFSALLGEITGLIGPNGAGKSTVFNACSGLLHPDAGRVVLQGDDVSGLGPAARARRGMGRTFQHVELFPSMTVRENVVLGIEGAMAGRSPLRHVFGRPGDTSRLDAEVHQAMELCGILRLSEHLAGSLSTSEGRLVELARCLAGPFEMLLLDEPSSGLDNRERAQFVDALRRSVSERGIGILLVEHDVAMVTELCSHIYVLDYGRMVFQGSPVDLRLSEVVRSAYLGENAGT